MPRLKALTIITVPRGGDSIRATEYRPGDVFDLDKDAADRLVRLGAAEPVKARGNRTED